jgi:hypothetical protein
MGRCFGEVSGVGVWFGVEVNCGVEVDVAVWEAAIDSAVLV